MVTSGGIHVGEPACRLGFHESKQTLRRHYVIRGVHLWEFTGCAGGISDTGYAGEQNPTVGYLVGFP